MRKLHIVPMLAALPVCASPDSMEKISEDHGLSLAISGMLIVFLGLVTIACFIALLPKLLSGFQKASAPKPVARPARTVPESTGGLDEATLTAIAMVLHSETERAAGLDLKVTLPLTSSPWALSSQMRVLPGRIK